MITRLQKSLWVALRLERTGRITFDDVHRELGVSMRTYRRIIADLREAGMILESRQSGLQYGGRLKGAFFVAFDDVLAPIVRAA